MIIIFLLSIILTMILSPFYTYIFIITLFAFVRKKRRIAQERYHPVKFLIVIPAHNEELSIKSSIESCLSISYDHSFYDIIVIADNCTDGTARVARLAGAEVFERTDLAHQSKGHALTGFFRNQPLINEKFDAVVFIDADTVVSSNLLSEFSIAISEGHDWLQCYYTVSNADATWRTRLMTYSFSLFNGVWLLGQERLGVAIGLKGNGMCFSTKGLRRVPWTAHGLTEDLEFSWNLRVAGEQIHFLPETRVYAAMPTRGGAGAISQRRRWEAGRKALRRTYFMPLASSMKIGLFNKTMYLIDLFFPPLVPLFLALLAAIILQFFALFDPKLLPAAKFLIPVHCLMTAALACYALSPFYVFELPLRYLTSLLMLPYFAAWKLLVVTTERMPSTWVRTPREPAV